MQSLWENTSPSFKAAFSQTLDIRGETSVGQEAVSHNVKPASRAQRLKGSYCPLEKKNASL